MSTCAPGPVPPVRRSSPLWKERRSLRASARHRRGPRARRKTRGGRPHRPPGASSAKSAVLPSLSGKANADRSKRPATNAKLRSSTFPSRSTSGPTENARLGPTRRPPGAVLAVGAEPHFVSRPARTASWWGSANPAGTGSPSLPAPTAVEVEGLTGRVATVELVFGADPSDASPARLTTGNDRESGVAPATNSRPATARDPTLQRRAIGRLGTRPENGASVADRDRECPEAGAARFEGGTAWDFITAA